MRRLFVFLGLLAAFLFMYSCKTDSLGYETKTATDANGYNYEYVTNDDSGTRIYTLENGLKVYLSVYKDEPRIQTLIPVKAGGKFDPANSTGLAHYLEHMMFKGTGTFGTKDWETEKTMLDSIEQMFEHYRTLTDADERKAWYEKIDAYSNEASKFAIANEYDKMCSFIGATGTNAYTTEDRTVYVNNIPANQLDNWLTFEANRFSMIVNRLFHTELEAVYEEKNRSLDNDNWKTYEAMYKQMFQKHKYGTQTVIGTIENLKNPSITDINAYFYKYYVPNNMAICLSGDLDPEKAIQTIDKHFGKLAASELEEYVSVEEDPITEPRVTEVWGPDSESMMMSFRFGGTSSADAPYVSLVDMILSNSTAGLIDINLNQKQKVLSAGSYVDLMNDYGLHTFNGKPRDGQSLDEVKDLILAEIEKVKNGEFDDWLIDAVINDFKKNQMRSMESNYARTSNMVMAFTNNMEWKEFISNIEKMDAITKEELVQFANDHYQNNYGLIYKRTGEDPNKVRVEKPSITKVEVDRSTRSPFFEALTKNEVEEISPVFVDYANELQKLRMKSDIPVLYKENTENDLFTLYYLLETGTNENSKIKLAVDYLKYLGTENYSPEEFKKELYKLGADFNVSSSNDQTYVYLSGLNHTMEPALKLFEELLAAPKADDEVLANMISDEHKQRSDAKKNKNIILRNGLRNYAMYGAKNPFNSVLGNEQLNSLVSDELLAIVKSIPQMEHRVMYYGPKKANKVIDILNANHNVPDKLNPLPEKVDYEMVSTDDPSVYWTHYDMVQAEIFFQSRGPKYDKKLAPEVQLYNEYFGGGMSGLVFQEIREAQGLAYSVFSSYSPADKKDKNDVLMAYIGTQADKQEEAMDALIDLINNMPKAEKNFDNAKKSILKKIESDRVTKTALFFNYLNAEKKGLDYDIRKDIYSRVKDMTYDDLTAFQEKYVKDKKYNVALVGDRNKLNFVALSKYGAVQELSLDELFGYDENIKEHLN